MGQLHVAVRQLARSPGFTGVALLTLTLGIGASVAIFSVVSSVLLRPLPYPQSDRLVRVQETLLPQLPEFAVSPTHYFAWRDHATSFENLAALHDGAYNLTGSGDPIRVSAGRVTSNVFPTLRSPPALGRTFSTADDVPGSEPVVILSDGFWRRQLGGRQDVLGQRLELDGRPFTVVGVMPPGFQLDTPSDIFTPAAYMPSSVHDIRTIARLKEGVTLEQARTEMALLAARLSKDEPAGGGLRGWGVKVDPLLDLEVRNVRALLLSLLGAVALLFLLSCANVANLLLARATVRARELAIRAALGASRARLVGQLLTESVVLALAGGLLGVVAAYGGVNALVAFAPDSLPRAADIGVDGLALGFASALAVIVGVGFGLVPAFQGTRVQLHDTLKQSGRGSGDGGRQQRLRNGLVVSEVGIALVLLIGAGLLIRSFARLTQVDPGFQPQRALAVTLSLPQSKYPAGRQVATFADQAVGRLSAIPGVEAVGASQGFQFSGIFDFVFLRVDGRPSTAATPRTNVFCIAGDYFKAMGIPLIRGRVFDARDTANAPLVTVINESMAKTYFAGEDPIGKRVDAVRKGAARWVTIVGVVGDVRHDRFDRALLQQGYAPLAQVAADWGALTLVVRSAGAGPTIPAVRKAILEVDESQAVTSVRPLGEWVARAIARQRLTTFLFAVFSMAALFLAAVGIYGVMAYVVTRRTNEIGIRIALGAHTADVLGLVFRQGGRLVALGLTVGLVGAAFLSHLIASLLFAVSPYDPVTFVAIPALLSAVAAIACFLPARRAARVDPMIALRAE